MRLIIFLLTVFVIFFIVFPSAVSAAEAIRTFDVQILTHKDGSFDVTENITYDFGLDERHGIYRDIPLVSKVGDLYRIIEVDFKQVLRDGVPEDYSTTADNSKASVKIGSADVTITGPHIYTIKYLVKNGIGSNFEDHDEVYWNITGNEWKVPIIQASARISSDFDATANKSTCFTGPANSTQKDCDASQIYSVRTTKPPGPYEGLTVVWGFNKGTFPASILQRQEPAEENPPVVKIISSGILAVPVILNFILAPILFIWYFRHKRKIRFGPPAVNFDLPKDRLGNRVTPAEAGSMDIHRVDQNDIIATIFDLAIRKHLKIEAVKGEKFLGIFGKDQDYLFTKLESTDQINNFERILMEEIFGSATQVKLSSLKPSFYLAFQRAERAIFDSLVVRGFYTKNPMLQMAGLFLLGVIAIALGGLILGIVLIFLSRKLNGRTALGDETDWKNDGLKIFLKNMKRHYTFQAKNLITVEKYIPYAIAFGYIKEFMEQLKVVYPHYKPSWYSSNVPFYVASSNLFSSMSSSFTTSAPSSSSGFSGGSSGGGGGGGGGGSW